MELSKILIADPTEEFPLVLEERLKGAFRVRRCGDGKEALELVRSFRPDVLVLDIVIPGIDGISLIQAMDVEGIRPRVLCISKYYGDYGIETLDKMNVDYLMLKPCDLNAAVERISDLSQRTQPQLLAKPDLRNVVSNILMSLNVPTKLRGYGCLREAVLVMLKDPAQSVTKELYPAVAQRCEGTAVQVERAIRSAITAAWNARDERAWQVYFQPGPDGTVPKPTNAAFISRLADHLLLDGEDQLVFQT